MQLRHHGGLRCLKRTEDGIGVSCVSGMAPITVAQFSLLPYLDPVTATYGASIGHQQLTTMGNGPCE